MHKLLFIIHMTQGKNDIKVSSWSATESFYACKLLEQANQEYKLEIKISDIKQTPELKPSM